MPESSRICGEPILAPGAHFEALAADVVAHARGALIFEDDARGEGVGDDLQVLPAFRRAQIGRRAAAPEAVAGRELKISGTFLARAVEVVVSRDTELLTRGDKCVADVAAHAHVGNAQRTTGAVERVGAPFLILRAHEIRKHVFISPPTVAQLSPVVVIPGLAANVQKTVDGAGPPQHLTPRPVDTAAVEARIRLGLVAPVGVRIVHRLEVAHRHVDPRVPVAPAGFEQQHTDRRIFAQAAGEHAAGGARTDDDVIELAQNHSVLHNDQVSAKRPYEGKTKPG
jgi:hypothetical protein